MNTTSYFSDLSSESIPNTISSSHFGMNFIAGLNQTSIEGNFESIVQQLGTAHIRYPGGTVTETYFDPNGQVWVDLFENNLAYTTASDGRLIEGPGRIFDFATRNDLEVTFVLPTDSLVEMIDGVPKVDKHAVIKVQALVDDILNGKFGAVKIDAFEIGNEYYHHPDMSAEEYAAVANDLILAVDEAIQFHASENSNNTDWTAPDITIQAGVGWQDGDNDAIINGLSTEALEAVTSVSAHFYSSNLELVPLRDQHLGQIEDWEDATGISDLNYHISEWNVSGTDSGMAQASTMLSAFDEMLSQGVDTSSMWGAQLRWLDSGLSVNLGGDDLEASQSRLSVSGEMIASMSESLVGLRSIEHNPDDFVEVKDEENKIVSYESGEYLVHVYGSDERAVIYISSRSDENIDLNLDIPGYFGASTHVWGETLTSRDDSSTGWRDETDPTSSYGVADFDGVTTYQINGTEPLTLEPFEIVRISVQLDGQGVTIEDHDPLISSDLNYNDNLVGSSAGDTIIAHIGNDSVIGRDGDDILFGGEDDDGVFGGWKNDAVFGGDGSDFVRGDSGDDWVIGGRGDDRVIGNSGNDILTGNDGNDTVLGGDGEDIISGGAGENELIGGSHADYFVVTSDSENVIKDFSITEGDQITFLGQYQDIAELQEHMSVTDNTDDLPGDIVITDLNGNQSVFEGMANHQQEFIENVVDFQEAGEAAISLASDLNAMQNEGLVDFIDSLDSEAFEGTFGIADGVILFANLYPDVASETLNALENDELSTFLNDVGADGLKLALSEMSEQEAFAFLDGVNDSVASEIVSALGEQTTAGAILNLSYLNQVAVSAKFFPTGDDERTGLSGNGSINETDTSSDDDDNDEAVIIPHVDPTTDFPDDDDDDEDDGSVMADCFVATVAYESGEHPDVWLLRWFRDAVMRKSLLGRLAIIFYWNFGPKLAEWVAIRPKAKRAILLLIKGIVVLISTSYGRKVGKQKDQPSLFDSRKIRLRR